MAAFKCESRFYDVKNQPVADLIAQKIARYFRGVMRILTVMVYPPCFHLSLVNFALRQACASPSSSEESAPWSDLDGPQFSLSNWKFTTLNFIDLIDLRFGCCLLRGYIFRTCSSTPKARALGHRRSRVLYGAEYPEQSVLSSFCLARPRQPIGWPHQSGEHDPCVVCTAWGAGLIVELLKM